MLIRVAQKIFPCCSLFFMSPLSLYKKFCGYNRKKCTISAFSSSLYQRAGYYTTKKELLSTKSSFFVIQAAGLVWNQRAPRVVWNPDEVAHGIARSAYRIKFLRLDAIHGVAVIPYGTACQFHSATSCG